MIEVIYNEENHGVLICIEHHKGTESHPFLVTATDGERIEYGIFDSHYSAKKVCQWLMGGFMFTGKLPTKEDLQSAKGNLGLRYILFK